MRDLDEILSGDLLELPIRGKTYRIAPIGYKDELRIKLATEAVAAGDNAEALRLMPNDEYEKVVLGATLDEMHADNLPRGYIIRAVMTAQAFHTAGRAVAEHMWENGPSPEALAASMQAALDSTTTSPSSAAAGSSTRKPASTRPTRSRTATAKPRSSPGRKRSTSGS